MKKIENATKSILSEKMTKLQNSIEIDNETGSIRIAAASLEALDQGSSIKESQSRNDSNNVLAINKPKIPLNIGIPIANIIRNEPAFLRLGSL